MTRTSTDEVKELKRRFYYTIPQSNKINVIWALSRVDALLQLSYGQDMVSVNSVRWLTE